ncbi:trigger factor [Ureaplasma canigenitalium]|uniref:trigger factor n=1 Tax=Ureaplasma canigenitalium TaxID=42092 RepID=UPI00068CD87B|nr:trigger factor [Ureaplasma canigenitalium]
MQLVEKKTLDHQIVFKVEVGEQAWLEFIDKAYDKKARAVQKKLKLPGFRPGKVPLAEVKKYVDQNEVIQQAANDAIPGAIQFIESTDEYKNDNSETVDTPTVSIASDEETKGLVFEITYDLYPKIISTEYKNLDIEYRDMSASDEEVQAEIDHALKVKTKHETKDENGVIEKGDEVTFDFVGKLDGKPFENGSATNYILTVGSNTFIPGFEDQMVGMKVNEEKTITVSFPKDYHEKSLAGEESTFDIKVHKIDKIIVPKFDDEFVKSLNVENVSTPTALKQYLKDKILEAKIVNQQQVIWTEMSKDLLANTKTTPIPKNLIENEKKALYEQVQKQLEAYNVNLKNYLKMTNKSEEEFAKELDEKAKDTIILSLIIEKIAKDNKLEPTKDEMEAKTKELAKQYQGEYEDNVKILQSELHQDMINETVMHEKVTKYLIETNKGNKSASKPSSKKAEKVTETAPVKAEKVSNDVPTKKKAPAKKKATTAKK